MLSQLHHLRILFLHIIIVFFSAGNRQQLSPAAISDINTRDPPDTNCRRIPFTHYAQDQLFIFTFLLRPFFRNNFLYAFNFFFGTLIVTFLEIPLNAFFPIVIILPGITTLVILLQMNICIEIAPFITFHTNSI